MREIVGVEISLWCRCEDGPDELRTADAVVVGCEADNVVFVAIASRAMSGGNVPETSGCPTLLDRSVACCLHCEKRFAIVLQTIQGQRRHK